MTHNFVCSYATKLCSLSIGCLLLPHLIAGLTKRVLRFTGSSVSPTDLLPSFLCIYFPCFLSLPGKRTKSNSRRPNTGDWEKAIYWVHHELGIEWTFSCPLLVSKLQQLAFTHFLYSFQLTYLPTLFPSSFPCYFSPFFNTNFFWASEFHFYPLVP